MSVGVRRLATLRSADGPAVGGKAVGLGELMAAGARVPDGVVLPVGIAELSPEERAAVARAAVAELGAGPFAVRSSGVGEDAPDHSYAGMYETVLDVVPDAVAAAVERCLASSAGERVSSYGGEANGRMAVIVQNMVAPMAAGVALTADPVTGDRQACVVSAVRGLGDRLVSGAASGDEWIVTDGRATARRQPERAIDREQVEAVAAEARRIATARGVPQDIEWAIDADGTLWILQGRPMTALPPGVSWEPPAPGAYSRAIRFGEWISEPVTPLFESWPLTLMEERLHARLVDWIGQYAPRPLHVVVNGWYFYSMNFFSPPALLRTLPRLAWRALWTPRRLAGLVPQLLHLSVPIFEREWREELLPRYRAAVADSERRVDTLPADDLPALIDRLIELAGDYFAYIAALGGGAYKVELLLAQFHRRHLAQSPADSHLPLLTGLQPPAHPGAHAVASLDWWHEPAPPAGGSDAGVDHQWLVEQREAAESAAFSALAASSRRLRRFRGLLAVSQHLVRVREDQARDLTLAWPVMRRAVLRIGEALVERGTIASEADVFFLTRPEMLAALAGEPLPATVDVAERRSMRDRQTRLPAPLLVGTPSRMLAKLWDAGPGLLGASPSDRALVTGTPASPGVASGPVRVVNGPAEFGALQAGEILVAPMTAPAWTPLFTRAAAVVTDVGSPASHASIIAREYGIPAVVGCGDATGRLRTGMRVTVNGATGNVEPE